MHTSTMREIPDLHLRSMRSWLRAFSRLMVYFASPTCNPKICSLTLKNTCALVLQTSFSFTQFVLKDCSFAYPGLPKGAEGTKVVSIKLCVSGHQQGSCEDAGQSSAKAVQSNPSQKCQENATQCNLLAVHFFWY